MPNENTKNVHVIKNQTNPNELFNEWNIDNRTNVKCAKDYCSNDVNNNAYIVYKIAKIERKYIVPLCRECYSQENNTRNSIVGNSINLGGLITVDEDLLLEYKQ